MAVSHGLNPGWVGAYCARPEKSCRWTDSAAGVYVGAYTRRTRERIWSEVAALIGAGSAVIAWTAPTDSGFAFSAIGENRREPADFDGLTLVRFKPLGNGTQLAGDGLAEPVDR